MKMSLLQSCNLLGFLGSIKKFRCLLLTLPYEYDGNEKIKQITAMYMTSYLLDTICFASFKLTLVIRELRSQLRKTFKSHGKFMSSSNINFHGSSYDFYAHTSKGYLPLKRYYLILRSSYNKPDLIRERSDVLIYNLRNNYKKDAI